MDISYQNLKNQKKYLSNIDSLLKMKAWRNNNMLQLKTEVKFLVECIEKERFKTNKYDMYDNLLSLVSDLGVIGCSAADDIWDRLDYLDFIRMFGAEVAGPKSRSHMSEDGTTYRELVYYDDNGKVLRKELVTKTDSN